MACLPLEQEVVHRWDTLKELSIKWVEPLTFIDTHFDLS
jgi:hypothetical protein